MIDFEIHIMTNTGWKIFYSEGIELSKEKLKKFLPINDIPEDLNEEYLNNISISICEKFKICGLKELIDLPDETIKSCKHNRSLLKGVRYLVVIDIFHNEFYVSSCKFFNEKYISEFEGKERFYVGEFYILKQFMQENTFYICNARNFSLGLWHNGKMYYLRSKFGDEYIDVEFHWDDGPEKYGTCKPIRAFSAKLENRISEDYLFDVKNWRAQNVLEDIFSCAESIFQNEN